MPCARLSICPRTRIVVSHTVNHRWAAMRNPGTPGTRRGVHGRWYRGYRPGSLASGRSGRIAILLLYAPATRRPCAQRELQTRNPQSCCQTPAVWTLCGNVEHDVLVVSKQTSEPSRALPCRAGNLRTLSVKEVHPIPHMDARGMCPVTSLTAPSRMPRCARIYKCAPICRVQSSRVSRDPMPSFQ